MKKLFFIFLTSTIIFSCSRNDNDDNSNNTTQESYLMPLKIGNNWTYNYTTYDQNGSTTSNSSVIFKDVKVVTKNNKDFHKLTISSGVADDLAFNFRNEDKLNVIGFTSSTSGQSEVLNMFRKVTSTQIINQTSSGNNSETFTAYPEEYNINGKVAYKVSDEIKESGVIQEITDYYLTPGVGYVKIERRQKKSNSSNFYTDELYLLQTYQLL